MVNNNQSDRQNIFLSLFTISLLLIVWFLITRDGFIKPIFLPSPVDTAIALWELLRSGIFLNALMASLGRILAATLLAVLVGGIVGLFMGVSTKIESLLSPITQPLRYLPITALIPLLILWLGIGEPMKILFLFFGIVFYFIPLVINAIRSTPQEYIDVARSFGANSSTIIKKVYWPHALPQIFDGLIVINGIGWTYVILAEIINAKSGLGYLINIASRLQKSDEVFAGLFLIALVAIGSDRLLRMVREKLLFW